MLSERIERMSGLTQTLALGNLHEKIIHNLCRLAEQMGWTQKDEYCLIQCTITHQEIAWMAGASRESVTVAMKELSQTGRIRTGFKSASLHASELRAFRKLTSPLQDV